MYQLGYMAGNRSRNRELHGALWPSFRVFFAVHTKTATSWRLVAYYIDADQFMGRTGALDFRATEVIHSGLAS